MRDSRSARTPSLFEERIPIPEAQFFWGNPAKSTLMVLAAAVVWGVFGRRDMVFANMAGSFFSPIAWRVRAAETSSSATAFAVAWISGSSGLSWA